MTAWLRSGGAAPLVVRRLLVLPLVLVAVAAMTFGLVAVSPYDPMDAYMAAAGSVSPETAERIARVWGFDVPTHEQFGRWLANVLRGDLGHSRLLGGQPVGEQLLARLGPSALLVSTALALVLVGGLAAGTLAAAFHGSWFDWLVRMASYVSVAAPSFWIGLLLLWVFAVWLGWLPAGGAADLRGDTLPAISLRHLVLPAVTLASMQFGWFAMYVRNQLLEVLGEDYVRFAEANGLSRLAVLFRHALPNALLPFVTLSGAHLSELIGGAVLAETVFGWPGVGNLAVEAATVVDLPLLVAITLAGSVLVIVGNLAADLTYRVIDPRIREAAR
ncbi:ABC transporter permease [Egibacter rhizosphaerae]|uniref:ABC transporter permease n=1 Tax=Egibacter rhizosphaerae TaxID=1670831 RepID=A0A411YFD4_9ACTN|nr:ABC transporter permease [Egibacter rhizosphaerae]QBI19940.1 ABC transporter permease [Egibacter rhizosphaerae]